VKNTGETTLKLEKIADANCSPITGPAKSELAPGEEAVEYTCSRELVKAGSYTNVAIVTGNGKETTSNEVEVELEKQSGFEVVKEQRFAGEASFTTEKLVSSKIPNTVEYEILVKNTGETTLKVEKVADANCATLVGPAKSELAPGEEAAEYTCSRELTAAGSYTNAATVTAGAEEKTTNEVEAELTVQKLTSFEVTKEQR